MIDPGEEISVSRQCRLLELSRSTVYYKPVPVNDRELSLMRQMDEIHLQYPFYGSRRIAGELRDRGYAVGRGHVRRLMRRMGIEALYRKPRLSEPHPGHKVYPYLLRDLTITRSNQVWAADICYIAMARGFCYLVAVMDWSSRRVLSWRLSNTLDPSFCVAALEEALGKFGTPEIFNTDQGSQFTADAFTSILKAHGVKISMDGRGRWLDNVFVERLWRSVKYEDVYLRAYGSIAEARGGLGAYFEFYNHRRRHQSLDSKTPDEVYWGQLPQKEVAA
jgi:putative transposase